MVRKKIKKAIIFDMDGTLYEFKEGSFKKSALKKVVFKNAIKYIAENLKKNNKEAKLILRGILQNNDENISLGLEKQFGLNRYDYFKKVWDIPAKNYIKKDRAIKAILLALQNFFFYGIISALFLSMVFSLCGL